MFDMGSGLRVRRSVCKLPLRASLMIFLVKGTMDEGMDGWMDGIIIFSWKGTMNEMNGQSLSWNLKNGWMDEWMNGWMMAAPASNT